MANLLYKDDFDSARDRLKTWWDGGDIGRPPIQLSTPVQRKREDLPTMDRPAGWLTGYSTSNYDFRVHCVRHACAWAEFLAEAVPLVSPDLGPNTLALFLGCRGVDAQDTVWVEPFIDDPDKAAFVVKPDNFYYDFFWRLANESLRLGRGKFLVCYPDLIEGLDTLAAMRGSQPLLMDMMDRPDWVHHCLRQITARYFEVYDKMYEAFKDDRGGTVFWAWAPGRMAKLQCDFSAMISAEMFGEFMVPVLREMTGKLDYCMYHWDGVNALQHHDHLLSLPRLTMLQWTPGAGQPGPSDPKWWPMHHKSLDAGKKLILGASKDEMLALKKEFGTQFKNIMLNMWAETPAQAQEILTLAAD
ncbi:MAG: hypothetical protein NT031_09430 [Planctomycetota bacterium]|nr:hypothetical protein [Planctomycetota bacterium]